MLKALLNQLFCFVLCLKCFFFVCYYLRIFRGFKRSDNLKTTFRQYVSYVLCIFSFLFWIICLLKRASVTVSSSDMHTFTHVIMVSCMKSKAAMCSMIFFVNCALTSFVYCVIYLMGE